MSDALKAREALRNHCQQLLDIIDNYDITHEAVDEDIEVVEAARAALSALDLSAIGAEGWKLVPVEPTEAMVAAAMNALDTPFYADLERAYAAMVEAAPSPPEPRS